MLTVAVMATNWPVNWEGPCTDAAIVAKWSDIRKRLAQVLPSSAGKIGAAKRNQVYELLGNSFYLPVKPDLELEKKVFAIVGADYMQFAIGEILNKYLKKYPCVNTSSSSSSSTSSIYSTSSSDSSSTSDLYPTIISSDSSSTSDVYSTISSDSYSTISSDVYSTISSDSYSTISPTDVYSTISSDSYSTISSD
ncbi:hypothetical protein GGI20_005487, partial [Coemansia sp. BCRC 34301]